MDPSDPAFTILPVFAQIAVATLGFSGITAAFVHVVSDRKFVFVRTKGLLYASGIALVGAMAPLASIPAQFVSVALVVAVTVSSGLCLYYNVKIGGHRSNRALVWFVNVTLLFAAFWLAWACVFHPEKMMQQYLLLILLLLITAAVLFVRVIVAMDEDGEPGRLQ